MIKLTKDLSVEANGLRGLILQLKDKLTLVYLPIIILIALVQLALGAAIWLWVYPLNTSSLSDWLAIHWLALIIFFGISLTSSAMLWLLFRHRLEKQLILKLDYLNQFMREFGKANPIPINGIIPETDEIDRLIESVLVMRNNYAVQKKSLEKLAYYDKLTGLPNRDYLIKECSRLIGQSSRQREKLAILHLDLTEFQEINTHLGKEVGDELLLACSKRLQQLIRAGDRVERKSINDLGGGLVARMSGVEFTFLLTGVEQNKNAYKVAYRILDGLSQPFIVQDHSLQLAGNIGISIFPDDANDPETLLKNADFALNKAKQMGSHHIEYFTADMNAHALHKIELEKNIRKALEKDQLILQFQPRVHLSTGKITTCEALLRWQSPHGELIPAAEFMTIAEETNLICDIGNWVFDQVCQCLKIWQAEGMSDLRVSINLSASQLFHKETYSLLTNYLELYGISGDSLELEVTESTLLKDQALAIEQIKKYRALGIKIALDDYGSNYSSLKLLQAIPLDVLKIDREFIQLEMFETGGKKLLKSVINIAHNFEIQTVACGIEEEFQVEFFRESSCDFIQGYYFSRPMASEFISGFVSEWAEGIQSHS